MNVQGPLDELAVFLSTPAKSGIVLTKGELIALARVTDTSLRVNERAWMLADVLTSSADGPALARQLDRLRAFAERSARGYREVVAVHPASAGAMAPWIARAEATADKLAGIAAEVRV